MRIWLEMVLQQFSIHSPGCAIVVLYSFARSAAISLALQQFLAVQHNSNKAYILGRMRIWLARILQSFSIYLPGGAVLVFDLFARWRCYLSSPFTRQRSCNQLTNLTISIRHIFCNECTFGWPALYNSFSFIHQVALLSQFCIHSLGALLFQFFIHSTQQSVQHSNITNKAYILEKIRIWLAMVLQQFSIHSPSGSAVLVLDPLASKAYFQKRICIWFCNNFSSIHKGALFQFFIHSPGALQSVQHSNNTNKAYILGRMCIWLARLVQQFSIHSPGIAAILTNNTNKAYILGRMCIWFARYAAISLAL